MIAKNNITIEKEKRQLLNSWTLELANWLVAEHSMKRSEAFRKAHLTRQLLGMLGEGEVTFCYMKANGEERQARGTLCPGVSVDFDHYVYKDEDADTFTRVLRRGVYVYFDLDRRAFRTFKAKNLIEIKNEDVDCFARNPEKI